MAVIEFILGIMVLGLFVGGLFWLIDKVKRLGSSRSPGSQGSERPPE